ncbi:MAG: PfkB family carbohydrate kinase [Proteobacteria bacterium]|nr:PfkB family carbohydrate kinase [Pseudomonadota bacterium]
MPSLLAIVVLTVTLNAAIDRTVTLARLDQDPDREALDDRFQAGGKGLNVARVLRVLGQPARAVVVVGGRAGRWLRDDLARGDIPFEAVEAQGETRTCLEIVERGSGRIRQVHGPGVEAGGDVVTQLLETVDAALPGARWLAVCGRLARGMPAGTVAQLVLLARSRGVPCAVDTSDAALLPAWRAGPALLRVNRAEAEGALGRPLAIDRPLPDPPGRTDLTVISDGPHPVLAWRDGGPAWRIAPPRIDLRNPIGCGDAMLAGLLAADLDGAGDEAALRRATALAAADAESPVAGCPDPARARTLAPAVAIRTLT